MPHPRSPNNSSNDRNEAGILSTNSDQGQARRALLSAGTALIGWFLLFLVMALFIFGSLFVAIETACSDLKDPQNMMPPVMLLIMLPVFTSATVLPHARRHHIDRALADSDGGAIPNENC